jgi:hypothetical protein
MNTFLLASFACVIALYNNIITPWGAVFLMSYSSIQLAEYFLWVSITDKNVVANNNYSIFAFCLLLLQPFASIMRLSKDRGGYSQRNRLLLAYAIFIVLAIIFTWCAGVGDGFQFKTSVAQNGHLVWHWVPVSLWLILPWIAFLIVPMYIQKRMIGLWFTSIILIISIATYWRHGTWGSMWCWFAAVASVFYIIESIYRSGLCF